MPMLVPMLGSLTRNSVKNHKSLHTSARKAPVLCSPLSELRRYRLGERLDGSTVA